MKRHYVKSATKDKESGAPKMRRPSVTSAGDLLQYSKSCGPTVKTPCASRGVKLEKLRRSLDAPELQRTDFSDPTLQPAPDPAKFRRDFTTSDSKQTNEDNLGIFIWENCQDLTDWCMDTATFASEYDFHIGESTTKDTAPQYLGSDASDLGKGIVTTIPQSIKNNAIPSFSAADDQWSMVKEEMEDENLISATPGGWLDLPALDLPDIGQVPNKGYSVTAEVQDSIDILRNNIGNDSFDLLSYLYEEESGTSASTTSSPQIVKHESDRVSNSDCQSYTSSSVSVVDPTEVAGKEPINEGRRQMRRNRRRKYDEDDDDYEEEEEEDKPSPAYFKRSRSSSYQDSDGNYRESREKNNEASRKSRMNKKAKETEMSVEAEKLERENRVLKMKVERLEKLVTSFRKTLLESALSRRNQN